MKKLLIPIALLMALQMIAQGEMMELTVIVENVKNTEGKIRIGLFDHADHFLEQELKGVVINAAQNSIVYTFQKLPKGVYAISLFHDENDNGKLDSNFMGIPSEPYGFSNNAKGMFGPPSFEDCKFSFDAGKHQITIRL